MFDLLKLCDFKVGVMKNGVLFNYYLYLMGS